jgi:membrane dipeptidase
MVDNPDMTKCLIALAVMALAAPVLVSVQAQSADPLMARALRLLQEAPIIDGHNDYPWVVREKANMDIATFDLRRPQPAIMTDFARLKAGGVGGQFWSVYVPGDDKTPVQTTLEQIDIVHQMVARYPDRLELALTADDILRIRKAGRIPSLIGMEGGHSIGNSLGILRDMYRLGARYMTLTHNVNLPWADSAAEAPVVHGLNAFGESVVREMNHLGMLVDLSHVSPETMQAAIKVSTAPVIFSHSNAKAVSNVSRNVPDDILAQLKTNGGIVMVTFVPSFASQAVADYNKQDDAYKKTHQAPAVTAKDIADHIDHIKKVAGIDHIGIGGDFDGIESVITGLEDVSKYPNLIVELLRRGYTDAEIKKITSENIIRVLHDAEAVARRTQPGKDN